MNDLALAVASLIVGAAFSVWLSSYYFRRSHRKSLTPYIQYASSPFRDLDPAVSRALDIKYQDVPVVDLFEIQFLIANTGDKAIRDVIRPLTFKVPAESDLLDATVIHRYPAELNVNTSVTFDGTCDLVVCEFPLLNSGDFFILKLLLNGTPKSQEFQFAITVDELPPTLKSERLPSDAVGTDKKRPFELPLLGVGIALALCGLAQFKVVYDSWSVIPSLASGLRGFFAAFDLSSAALLLSVVPAFFFTLFGAMLSAAACADGSFPPKKKRFIIPEDVHGRGFRFRIREALPKDG